MKEIKFHNSLLIQAGARDLWRTFDINFNICLRQPLSLGSIRIPESVLPCKKKNVTAFEKVVFLMHLPALTSAQMVFKPRASRPLAQVTLYVGAFRLFLRRAVPSRSMASVSSSTLPVKTT